MYAGLAEAVASPSVSTDSNLGVDGTGHGTAGDHGAAGDHGSGGHGGAHEGIHIFTAEFARVEIPFIISLWIFCASLAKIGKLICGRRERKPGRNNRLIKHERFVCARAICRPQYS